MERKRGPATTTISAASARDNFQQLVDNMEPWVEYKLGRKERIVGIWLSRFGLENLQFPWEWYSAIFVTATNHRKMEQQLAKFGCYQQLVSGRE